MKFGVSPFNGVNGSGICLPDPFDGSISFYTVGTDSLVYQNYLSWFMKGQRPLNPWQAASFRKQIAEIEDEGLRKFFQGETVDVDEGVEIMDRVDLSDHDKEIADILWQSINSRSNERSDSIRIPPAEIIAPLLLNWEGPSEDFNSKNSIALFDGTLIEENGVIAEGEFAGLTVDEALRVWLPGAIEKKSRERQRAVDEVEKKASIS